MATKKSPSKKTAPSEPAAKSAAKKVAAKSAKTVDVQASAAADIQPKAAAKPQPTHHDISVQAYLLWERDGKKHGQHADHWEQAERDLAGS